MLTETKVRSIAESHVTLRTPSDIEAIRHLEGLGITVGGTVVHDHFVAGSDELLPDSEV